MKPFLRTQQRIKAETDMAQCWLIARDLKHLPTSHSNNLFYFIFSIMQVPEFHFLFQFFLSFILSGSSNVQQMHKCIRASLHVITPPGVTVELHRLYIDKVFCVISFIGQSERENYSIR